MLDDRNRHSQIYCLSRSYTVLAVMPLESGTKCDGVPTSSFDGILHPRTPSDILTCHATVAMAGMLDVGYGVQSR
jgi:hypothetical protein